MRIDLLLGVLALTGMVVAISATPSLLARAGVVLIVACVFALLVRVVDRRR
jgi:hypothetical protein